MAWYYVLSGARNGPVAEMAFWDEEKRTLHDRICETRVMRVQTT